MNWQDWEGRPLDLRTAGALTLAVPSDASVHSSLLIALGTDQDTASDWAVIPLPDARRYQSGRMMVNLDSGARLLLSSDDVAATYRSATLVIEVAAPDVSQADRLAQNCADAGLAGDVRWERPFLATITALTPNPWADWTGAASIPYPKPTPAANGHVDDARLIPGGNTTGTVLTWTGPDAYDADWLTAANRRSLAPCDHRLHVDCRPTWSISPQASFARLRTESTDQRQITPFGTSTSLLATFWAHR